MPDVTWMIGWLDDPESSLPLSDEQRARLRQERAADAVEAEREQVRRETDADDREARLLLEARLSGRSPVKGLPEVLDDARAQGAREDRAEERRRLLEGAAPVVKLDDMPAARRPPEVQAVADKRSAREAREFGQALVDAGKAMLGGLIAAFPGGKRL